MSADTPPKDNGPVGLLIAFALCILVIGTVFTMTNAWMIASFSMSALHLSGIDLGFTFNQWFLLWFAGLSLKSVLFMKSENNVDLWEDGFKALANAFAQVITTGSILGLSWVIMYFVIA